MTDRIAEALERISRELNEIGCILLLFTGAVVFCLFLIILVLA